jgi:hypothetical protein
VAHLAGRTPVVVTTKSAKASNAEGSFFRKCTRRMVRASARNRALPATSAWSGPCASPGVKSTGLPVERRRRLPEVDRAVAREDVTPGHPWDFHLPGVLSPAVSGEESRWVLRDWGVWSALQSRGVRGGGEGVVEGTARVPSGSHTVSSVLTRDPACFCRKIPRVIGADVYRNSTVDRG